MAEDHAFESLMDHFETLEKKDELVSDEKMKIKESLSLPLSLSRSLSSDMT